VSDSLDLTSPSTAFSAHLVAQMLCAWKAREKIGTASIIIGRLSRCMHAFGMPHMSKVVAIGFPHHPT